MGDSGIHGGVWTLMLEKYGQKKWSGCEWIPQHMWMLGHFETTDKEKPEITGALVTSNASSYLHVTWSF